MLPFKTLRSVLLWDGCTILTSMSNSPEHIMSCVLHFLYYWNGEGFNMIKPKKTGSLQLPLPHLKVGYLMAPPAGKPVAPHNEWKRSQFVLNHEGLQQVNLPSPWCTLSKEIICDKPLLYTINLSFPQTLLNCLFYLFRSIIVPYFSLFFLCFHINRLAKARDKYPQICLACPEMQWRSTKELSKLMFRILFLYQRVQIWLYRLVQDYILTQFTELCFW